MQAVAKLLVEESKHGLTSDPSSTIGEIAAAAKINLEDAEDAVYALEEYGFLRIDKFLGKKPSDCRVRTMPSLFVEFDRYFMGWNAKEDAVQIATDMINNKKFTASPEKIAEQYDWSPRRLNPAIYWLEKRKMVTLRKTFGTAPYICAVIKGDPSALRRLVKGENYE